MCTYCHFDVTKFNFDAKMCKKHPKNRVFATIRHKRKNHLENAPRPDYAFDMIKKRANILTTGAIALGLGSALMAQDAGKTIDCYCTDKTGERIELGTTICMEVDGRVFSARCEMALNNPFWREVEGGCLHS